MKKKILFDCDNMMGQVRWELDDGLTLFYILGCSELELLGITTTFGNGKIEKVMYHTKRLLKAIRREDISLIKGASKKEEPPTDAARFLADKAASYPGEITLLAAGPLGNLRGAAQIDPNFFKNLKELIFMGGHINHPFKMGKIELPDTNLAFDLKATLRVLHAECPVSIINSEICTQVPFTTEYLGRVNFFPETVIDLIKGLISTYVKFSGLELLYIWDVLVPVLLTNPDLFDKNLVRIKAADVEDINYGHLVTTDNDGEVLVNMPSKILNPDRFMDVVIDTWERFHNFTLDNKGYDFSDYAKIKKKKK